MLVLFLSLFGILLHNVSANTSSCSVEDLRTCRSDALERMGSSSGGDASHQEKQCRDLRGNFDCMLWQTSMCFKKEDQDSNSDIILKSWRYLEGFCEKYGNWWASSCFQRDDVKRCESLLPSKRNSLDNQSCRMFVNFRDCVAAIAESSCSSSDRNLLGTYFMEKGQQMSWRCPKETDDFGSMTAASAQQVDRRYPNMYGDSPSSSLDTCALSARSDLQTCREKFDRTRNEAMRRDDSDMRNHQLCCSLIDFGECLNDAAVKKCGENVEAAKALTDQFMSGARAAVSGKCEEITAAKCNDGNSVTPMKAVIMYFLLYLAHFVYVKFF